jgi:hypothetical protein
MGETTTITLHYDRTVFDALQEGGQIWLRVSQIDLPLGFSHPNQVTRLYNRHRDEFTSDEARMIVEETAGGPQQVRVFSLRGARLLAMLARTEPAARFRRWLLDLLEGRAPVSRPAPDALENLPADSEHQRAQHQERTRAQRLAALAGLRLDDLRQLRKLERILARIPSLREQPSLPLDA